MLKYATESGGTVTAELFCVYERGKYIFEIKAKDNVGWVSDAAYSTCIVRFIDTTPPPRPAISNLVPNLQKKAITWVRHTYISSTATVKMRWNSVTDSGSGIYEYQAGIASENEIRTLCQRILGRVNYSSLTELENTINAAFQLGTFTGPSILPWTSVGRNLEFYTQNLSLDNGAKVYYLVKAVNGKGLSNIGVAGSFTVDSTPPRIIEVQDEGRYKTTGLKQLSFRIRAEEPESPIELYTGSIRKRLDSGVEEDVYRFDPFPFLGNISTGTGELISSTITKNLPATLTTGSMYYIRVQLRNKALKWSNIWSRTVYSDGIFVDPVPPARPVIRSANGTYSTSEISFNLSATDITTGIAKYRYRIYYIDRGIVGNVVSWTQWYPVTSSRQTDVHGGIRYVAGTILYSADTPYYEIKPRSANITVIRQGLSLVRLRTYYVEVQTKDDAENESLQSFAATIHF